MVIEKYQWVEGSQYNIEAVSEDWVHILYWYSEEDSEKSPTEACLHWNRHKVL